jgi:hypothetical protein
LRTRVVSSTSSPKLPHLHSAYAGCARCIPWCIRSVRAVSGRVGAAPEHSRGGRGRRAGPRAARRDAREVAAQRVERGPARCGGRGGAEAHRRPPEQCERHAGDPAGVAHPGGARAGGATPRGGPTAAWLRGVASPSTRVQGRRAVASTLRRTLAPRASARAACAASCAASAATRAAAKRSTTSRGGASSEGWQPAIASSPMATERCRDEADHGHEAHVLESAASGTAAGPEVAARAAVRRAIHARAAHARAPACSTSSL